MKFEHRNQLSKHYNPSLPSLEKGGSRRFNLYAVYSSCYFFSNLILTDYTVNILHFRQEFTNQLKLGLHLYRSLG